MVATVSCTSCGKCIFPLNTLLQCLCAPQAEANVGSTDAPDVRQDPSTGSQRTSVQVGMLCISMVRELNGPGTVNLISPFAQFKIESAVFSLVSGSGSTILSGDMGDLCLRDLSPWCGLYANVFQLRKGEGVSFSVTIVDRYVPMNVHVPSIYTDTLGMILQKCERLRWR